MAKAHGLFISLIVIIVMIGSLSSLSLAQEPNPEASGLQFQQPADEAFTLPHKFMPQRMQKMLLFPDDIFFVTPSNFKALEDGDPEIIVKGKMRTDNRYNVSEAHTIQNFTIMPPKEGMVKGTWTDDSALRLVISIRYMPKRDLKRLQTEFNANKSLPAYRALSYFKNTDPNNLQKARVDSFIDTLPRGDAYDADDQVLWKYQRVHNRWDYQPETISPELRDACKQLGDQPLNWLLGGSPKNKTAEQFTEIPSSTIPVNQYYLSYTGWKRHPRASRSSIWTLPEFVTIEGKLMFIKSDKDGNYLVNMEFAGKNPVNPLEFVNMVARKMINAAWDADLRVRLYDYDFYDGYTPYGP